MRKEEAEVLLQVVFFTCDTLQLVLHTNFILEKDNLYHRIRKNRCVASSALAGGEMKPPWGSTGVTQSAKINQEEIRSSSVPFFQHM